VSDNRDVNVVIGDATVWGSCNGCTDRTPETVAVMNVRSAGVRLCKLCFEEMLRCMEKVREDL
jgi:hypothetical protein